MNIKTIKKNSDQNQNKKLKHLLDLINKVNSNSNISYNNSIIINNSINNNISLLKENNIISNDISKYLSTTNNVITNNFISTRNYNKDNNKSFLSFCSLNSFSIKNENQVHLSENENDEEENLLNGNNKIIVYNISDEFLIQMTIINQCTDPNFIKLQYNYKNEEIIVNKNDVFYQFIDSFECLGNLSEMKIINELAVLKNMQLRLLNRKSFIFNGDIFINFKCEKEENDEEINNKNFMINEFIKNIKNNEILFFLNEFNNKNNKHAIEFFNKYLICKNYDLYEKYNRLFNKLFNILNCNSNGNKFFFHLNITNKNKETLIYFNYLPILSSNVTNNELYETNILFCNNVYNNKNKVKINLNPEININVTKMLLNNNNKNSSKIKEIFKKFLSEDVNILFINELYELFTISNLSKYFIECVKLILLSYLSFNYKKIFFIKDENNEEFFEYDVNLIYFSNIIALILFKYINSLLNNQLINNKFINKINQKNKEDDLIILFNSSNKEDDMLINEVIKQRSDYLINDSFNSSKNCISKFIALYLNKNISNFFNSLNKKQKEIIKSIENDFFDIKFLFKLYEENDLLNVFTKCYSISLNFFNKFESKISKIYQFWNLNLYDLYENNNEQFLCNYELFFSNQEKIIEFLQISQIIEYCNLYHNEFYSKKNKFFINFSFSEFFYRFLPILIDIDNSYNENKDYSQSIINYLNEINEFQGIDLKTGSFVDKEKRIIYLSFNTYEILNLLLKNVYDENVILIQKIFKSKMIFKFVNNLRKKCVKIQKWFRLKFYNKKLNLESFNDNLYNKFEIIIEQYKKIDPLVIRFVINSMKNIEELIKENNNLKEYLNELNNKSEENNNKEAKTSNLLIYQNNELNNDLNLNSSENQKNNDEINYLNKKLSEKREKFKKLVAVIAEYEQKMKNFVKMINSNEEIKEILNKNGISIN